MTTHAAEAGRRGRVGWLGLGLVLLASGVWAADTPPTAKDDNPQVWKPKIRSVAVFKNGLGFFLSDAEVQLRDGWCQAQEIPPAAFGTLAVYAQDEHCAVDIVGAGNGEIVEFDDRDAPDQLAARLARLQAAKNLRLELRYLDNGQTKSATGKLASVGAEFVVLKNEETNLAVPVAAIQRMQILDLPLRVHLQGDGKAPPDKAVVGMAYLCHGIAWIPDYTLKVLDDETAELTLRGTLINNAADLIHTDVQLVVGVPHFVHADKMAPLTLGMTLRALGSALPVAGIPQAAMTQLMNRAALVSNAEPTVRGTNAPSGAQPEASLAELNQALANLPQLEGPAASDYTVYTKKDLTLRRGEKALLTLFTQKIRCSHRYRWSLPAPMTHALVLHNGTASPWTTGPCLALSGQRPLSEDLLGYTPANAHCELPVTTAINIAHEQAEQEVDRKRKADALGKDVFLDLVTVEGKLRLHNYESREAPLEIAIAIPGRPTQADQEGQFSMDASKLRLVEREGHIRWTVKLAPNEEKTLVYRYERYVPSN